MIPGVYSVVSTTPCLRGIIYVTGRLRKIALKKLKFYIVSSLLNPAGVEDAV